SMSTPRSSATGAALFPLADGQLLVAGGSNQQTDANGVVTATTSSTGELYGFATLETDASDYAPGTPVIMTGTGWQPSETVNLYMVATPSTADTNPLQTTAADSGGNIMYGAWAPDTTDINARFYLTAVGATSGAQAQNTFTDHYNTTDLHFGVSTVATGNSVGAVDTTSGGFTPASCTAASCAQTSSTTGGDVLQFTATAGTGYAFSTWTATYTGGSAAPLTCSTGATTNPCTLTTPSGSGNTATIIANFVAAPTKLAITTISPASPTAGSAFSVTVQSQNSSGTAMNVTANTTITLTLAAGTGTLGGTLTGTITAGSSSVIITGVTYTKAESILKITATASGGNTMTAATSSAITVQPGAANKLVLGQAPTTTTAGSAFSPAIVVDVEDANGNVVTTDSSTVTLTITNGYFSGSVTTATATAVSGVATFTGLTPITAGTTETVKATDGTLTSVTSSAFTVNAAALNKLAFTNTAISTTVGTCSVFTLQSQDQYGNAKTVSGSTTVNLSTSSSGGHFYSNVGCTTSITTATIANGASAPTGSTYYKDSVGGQPTLTASATGITNNGTQVETENLAPSITSANNTAFTYGTAGSFSVTATGYPAPTFSVTAGTLPSGVTLSSAGALSGTPTASGTFTITITASNGIGTNATQSFTLTVNKVQLTVTASAAAKTYGAANPTFTYTMTGFVNGDTQATATTGAPSLTTTATTSSSVGSYTITAAAGTLASTNYTFTYANGTLTVSVAPLTITASAQSKNYGAALTLGTTAFISSGLQNGETVGSVTLTSSGAAATATVAGSPYTITPSAATGGTFTASNYTITYNTGSLTVSAVPLTITASARSKNYGTALALGTTAFTTGTLYNGDTVSGVTLTSSGAAATATVAGSPYTIVPSAAAGTGLSNYNISYANGSLAVSAAPLTITASAQSKNYGTALTLGTTAFTTGTLYNGDTVSGVTLTSSGAAATAGVAGSPYSIVPSAAVGTGLSN
ncbi:MAG: MBG domain-containing protein, partial [Terracidiphilus sp.]|nr:MBG domain-containing protein [Terracidiphilus sp.]